MVSLSFALYGIWWLEKITLKDVDDTWKNYAFEQRSQVENELDLLSNAQRKLLVALARCNGTHTPRGKDFQMQSGMPGATIAQALKFLENKDYVYQNSNQCYTILDPSNHKIYIIRKLKINVSQVPSSHQHLTLHTSA